MAESGFKPGCALFLCVYLYDMILPDTILNKYNRKMATENTIHSILKIHNFLNNHYIDQTPSSKWTLPSSSQDTNNDDTSIDFS